MSAEALNDIMEFDRVIEVLPDGTIVHRDDLHGPEVYDDDVSDGWELLSGYTGQDRYNGPHMHSSEFIGGRMEDDIRSTPGIYVAVVVYTLDEEYEDDNVIGWAVARKL